MSSRPATPTDHSTPQPQPETTRKTRSQTRQSQLLDLRRDMIATAQYQGHNPYLHPRHSLQELHRHEQSSTTVQFAPPEFSFDTSYNTSAVTSADLAVSSGSVEGRREAQQEIKVGPYKHVQDTTPSTHLRHSPSVEGSSRQPFIENERVAEVPTAPSKKKRTRTLTTSNQSSVLLALLAKTPFPTTAEREEVGRAIGLTARKVQVWFQNQRQKQKKSGQTESYSSVPQGATTSAPLPLSRQPGFSASHAARMGLHSQSSPPYSSSIAPYPAGSSNRDAAEPGQYNISPPLAPAPPRGHVTEPYHPGTAYSRSFTEQSSYYSLRPGSAAESEQYQQLSQANAPGASQSFTGHPGSSQSTYVTGDFSDPFGHHAPPSREPSTHSFGYPPQSQDPSLSDDQSRPTTSRGSQPYGHSSDDSWRTKPLPPLPSEAGRPSTGQSLNWDPNSPEHGFRPPVPPSRSRAFSNPDTTVAGYRPGRAYVPTPATAGLTPSVAFPSSRFYTSAMPPDTVTPNSYQALSDFHHEEVQQLRHQTSSGSVGESYSLRYGDHYTSPGGVSSSSSLAYSEPAGLGLPPTSQHSGSVTYSPIEQRRTRLSYDSSLVSGQVLGKRPWTADEGRSTKRARTDDGHASLPIRASTRGPPPSTYQHQPSPLGNQSTHEMHLAPRINLPISRSEDPHYHYHYEQPPSDPASGV